MFGLLSDEEEAFVIELKTDAKPSPVTIVCKYLISIKVSKLQQTHLRKPFQYLIGSNHQ